jgi:hypothetical protein
VSKVERKDRERVALGNCHHRSVYKSEIEIRVLGVQLNRSPQEPGSHEDNSVLTLRKAAQELAGLRPADPIPHQVIDLDHDNIWNDKVTSEPSHERSGQRMRGIAAIHRRDDRPGVGDDTQRFASASRRYFSTRWLRSGGPSPDAT